LYSNPSQYKELNKIKYKKANNNNNRNPNNVESAIIAQLELVLNGDHLEFVLFLLNKYHLNEKDDFNPYKENDYV